MLPSPEVRATLRRDAQEIGARLVDALRRQLGREALLALLHVAILLALVAWLRPLFFRGVSEAHYRAPSIFLSMLKSDLTLVQQGAKRHSPVVPEALTFFVPLVIFVLAKRKLRWSDWEHGRALRVWVMAIVIMLAWSGATFPFNMYLGRAHFLDRSLVTLFAALSWRYPIMVPLAVRGAIVMIKEPYYPIPHDDFDFRAPAEVAIIFSVFVWASISRSFQPKHFLVAGVGSFADYYYSAGLAKWNFGPEHSWLLENRVSNISVASYVRGWASWVPEATFMKFAAMARELDVALQGYTLFIELGAIVLVYLHPRVTRWFFLGAFVLNFGIFLMTGICFWKWMVVSFTAFFWMGGSGRPIVDRMHEYKLPLVLGIVAIYYGNERVWYYPQTRVVWYDTRLTENYEIFAVGESGQRYLVAPTYFEPMDMHWTQGRLCYATDNERSITGIYGTSGNYRAMKQLEEFDTPEKGLAMPNRGRACRDPKQQKKFDEFMKTFFGNINRRGGRPHDWIGWIGRPTHLWVFPKDSKETPHYDEQEKVVRVELVRTVVYHHKDALHRSEPKLTHAVEIPH